MSVGIVIKQIARRSGVKGVPRSTIMTGRVLVGSDEDIRRVARQVLAEVKKKTNRDGKDRQIELVEIKKVKGGGHRTRSKVLYRVYRSHSDHKIHVYKGPAHQGPRENKEA